MFASQRQTNLAIYTLLRRIRQQHLWSLGTGPLFDDVVAQTARLSSGERVLVAAALDVYNGHGGVRIASLLHGPLDVYHAKSLVRLIFSALDGPSAVDAWMQSEDRIHDGAGWSETEPQLQAELHACDSWLADLDERDRREAPLLTNVRAEPPSEGRMNQLHELARQQNRREAQREHIRGRRRLIAARVAELKTAAEPA